MLSELATIRSKNAGPFWLTVDVFCDNAADFARVVNGVSSATVAQRFGLATSALRRFDIADLNVVKFSLPRPHIQGSRLDRDMHGAAFAHVLADIVLTPRDAGQTDG